MELLSESGGHGNLAAFGQSCKSAIHAGNGYHVNALTAEGRLS